MLRAAKRKHRISTPVFPRCGLFSACEKKEFNHSTQALIEGDCTVLNFHEDWKLSGGEEQRLTQLGQTGSELTGQLRGTRLPQEPTAFRLRCFPIGNGLTAKVVENTAGTAKCVNSRGEFFIARSSISFTTQFILTDGCDGSFCGIRMRKGEREQNRSQFVMTMLR